MNRIVILGSSGFLGKSLRQKLSKEKFNVKYMIHKKNTKLKNNEFYGDILDKKSLLNNIKDGDIVINLVGQIDEDLSQFISTNLLGSLNLLEITKLKKNIKIIFASSINVYGNNCHSPSKENDIPLPLTLYGRIKFLSEQLYEIYSKLYGFNIIILRFSNIYGKNKKSGIISNIIKSSYNKPVIFSHKGEQKRDFLFIDDAIDSIMKSLTLKLENCEIFNISSCEKYSPKQIISIIENISKRKIYFNLFDKNDDEKCIWADNSKAKQKLQFEPQIDFKGGLENFLNNNL